MSTATLTAGTVMNMAAAILNDVSRTVYPYSVQVPFLQMALQELEEYFALHNAATSESISATITVPSGSSSLEFDQTLPIPSIPLDMIDLVTLWERPSGNGNYAPMKRVNFLSHDDGTPRSSIGAYAWQEQKITFGIINQAIDIKFDYLRSLFATIVDETSDINILNGRTFLEYRTAGLIAEFIENNELIAAKHNGYASLALDRATGITVKGKQTIMTRRRPFRSGFKRRS